MRKGLIISLVFVIVVLPGCKTKAKAIIFVNETENMRVMGEMTFSRTPSGEFEPQTWAPGNVIIFRVDHTVGEMSGKAGEAYLIKKDLSVKFIRKIDLSKSDDEIAAQFGIKQQK